MGIKSKNSLTRCDFVNFPAIKPRFIFRNAEMLHHQYYIGHGDAGGQRHAAGAIGRVIELIASSRILKVCRRINHVSIDKSSGAGRFRPINVVTVLQGQCVVYFPVAIFASLALYLDPALKYYLIRAEQCVSEKMTILAARRLQRRV